jgi:hypothetical protein
MPKQTFSTETILRCFITEAEEFFAEQGKELTDKELAHFLADTISDTEIIGTNKFGNINQLVFMHEGKYWSCEFETNDGAGYNDIFGIRWPVDAPPFTRADDGTWVFHEVNVECKSFHCIEVHQVTRTVVEWEEVAD